MTRTCECVCVFDIIGARRRVGFWFLVLRSSKINCGKHASPKFLRGVARLAHLFKPKTYVHRYIYTVTYEMHSKYVFV